MKTPITSIIKANTGRRFWAVQSQDQGSKVNLLAHVQGELSLDRDLEVEEEKGKKKKGDEKEEVEEDVISDDDDDDDAVSGRSQWC